MESYTEVGVRSVSKEELQKLGIPMIPDKDYEKAVGQLRLQLGVVLENFRMYGQDVYIPGALEEAVKL